MKRGWIVCGMLVTCLVFYITALRAAGIMVCLPAEQTVCAMTQQGLLPAQVPGTALRVLDTVCYEGPSLDTGEDIPIANAMAILVENTGTEHIRTGWVMLTGAGERYLFLARDLPPGSRTILLETGGASWTQEPFDSITGGATTAPEDLLAAGQLEIRDVDLGSVSVTNLSESTLTDVMLTYKNYLSEADVYQGGIAYGYQIPLLHPGETITISPGHYCAGYSRFVYAATQ